jgi:hypothetical protein
VHTRLFVLTGKFRLFLARSQNCEKRRLVCHARPSVRMEQRGSHLTDFHEILFLSIFPKPVDKIQVPLKPVNNDGT